MRQRKRCGVATVAEPLPRDWWTASDVATFLGIVPSTIRAYVARGQMPAADSGRMPRQSVGRGVHWHGDAVRSLAEEML